MDAAVIVTVLAAVPTGVALWGRLVEWWRREPVRLDALDGVGSEW